jgi:hypothetical protein
MSLTKVSYSMIQCGATYNMLDFGAIGDGVTNDSAAFNAIIAKIVADGNKGANIVFPPGYTFLGKFTVPATTPPNYINNVNIIFSGATLKGLVGETYVLGILGNNNQNTITGGWIDTTNMANADTVSGLYIVNGYDYNVSNIRFTHTGGSSTAQVSLFLYDGCYTSLFQNLSGGTIKCLGTAPRYITTCTFLSCDVRNYIFHYASSNNVIGGAVQYYGSTSPFRFFDCYVCNTLLIEGVDVETSYASAVLLYSAGYTYKFTLINNMLVNFYGSALVSGPGTIIDLTMNNTQDQGNADVNGNYLWGSGLAFSANKVLGLNVLNNTPKVWNANKSAVQLGGTGAVWSGLNAISADINFGMNLYYDASNNPQYITGSTGIGLMSIGPLGQFAWRQAASGLNPVVLSDRMLLDENGYLLIGYTASNGAYKLQVNSQIFATSGTIATSDGNYKKDVAPLTNALDLVGKLNPVSFNWKDHPTLNFDKSTKTVGFIAQEVKEALKDTDFVNSIIKKNDCVIENAVQDSVTGEVITPAVTEEFYGIAEGNLIAILTKAIQELKSEVDALKMKIGG